MSASTVGRARRSARRRSGAPWLLWWRRSPTRRSKSTRAVVLRNFRWKRVCSHGLSRATMTASGVATLAGRVGGGLGRGSIQRVLSEAPGRGRGLPHWAHRSPDSFTHGQIRQTHRLADGGPGGRPPGIPGLTTNGLAQRARVRGGGSRPAPRSWPGRRESVDRARRSPWARGRGPRSSAR